MDRVGLFLQNKNSLMVYSPDTFYIFKLNEDGSYVNEDPAVISGLIDMYWTDRDCQNGVGQVELVKSRTNPIFRLGKHTFEFKTMEMVDKFFEKYQNWFPRDRFRIHLYE